MVNEWRVFWNVLGIAGGGAVGGVGIGPGGELMNGSIDGAVGDCIGGASGRKTRKHGSGETLLERGDHVDGGFIQR